MENAFIKIDGIPGEAREKNHADWIPIKSFDWEIARTLDMSDLGTTQRGYANAEFGKMELSSELSKASAKLCTYVASGKPSKEIIIHLCRAGADQAVGMEPYLIVKMRDAIIDSYNVSGGEDAIPEEKWTLAYRGIEYTYKPADFNTGELGSPEVFKWNLETGDVS